MVLPDLPSANCRSPYMTTTFNIVWTIPAKYDGNPIAVIRVPVAVNVPIIIPKNAGMAVMVSYAAWK